MTYLYHRVPKNLRGDTLFPLNMLKDRYPDEYKTQMGKYVGREHIQEQLIPKLDCLWGDVLHFSAVDPMIIKQSLIEAGLTSDFCSNYYQVDPMLLEEQNTIVYLYSHATDQAKMNKENFVPYHSDDVAQFSRMPKETKEYYKQMIANGKLPLLYHKIPHILYRGKLKVSGLTIISV